MKFFPNNLLGKQYEIPVTSNFIKADDLSKIKDHENTPMWYYDPGYTNTIACVTFLRQKIDLIDL
jgi:hypothetical protein